MFGLVAGPFSTRTVIAFLMLFLSFSYERGQIWQNKNLVAPSSPFCALREGLEFVMKKAAFLPTEPPRLTTGYRAGLTVEAGVVPIALTPVPN
jgi:hypothetical protein